MPDNASGIVGFGILVLGVCAAIVRVLIRYLLVVVTVKGDSMAPTLIDGNRIVVLKHYPRSWLALGRVVVGHFAKPPDGLLPGPNHELSVKRIVGTGGDTVVVNALDIPEALRPLSRADDRNGADYVWHIDRDHYFVRGDSRRSVDSVIWGQVPKSSVFGVRIATLPLVAERLKPSGVEVPPMPRSARS